MSALDDWLSYIKGELRTGGGATLDELYDLGIAIREELNNL